MELFAEYLKERSGRELIEEPGVGFASFEIVGEECYIVDIFVRESARKLGHAAKLADKIAWRARVKGCTHLKGTVDLLCNGARESTLALLHYGFRPVRAQGEVIFFRKDL